MKDVEFAMTLCHVSRIDIPQEFENNFLTNEEYEKIINKPYVKHCYGMSHEKLKLNVWRENAATLNVKWRMIKKQDLIKMMITALNASRDPVLVKDIKNSSVFEETKDGVSIVYKDYTLEITEKKYLKVFDKKMAVWGENPVYTQIMKPTDEQIDKIQSVPHLIEDIETVKKLVTVFNLNSIFLDSWIEGHSYIKIGASCIARGQIQNF